MQTNSGMNKKILETRLHSIDHYLSEAKLHEQAKEVCLKTREEIINSLREFFPFTKHQIICTRQTVFRVDRLKETYTNSSGIYFRLLGSYPNGNRGYSGDTDQLDIEIKDLDKWKIIFTPNEP